MYVSDASVYRQVPAGMVIPRNAEDVLRALDARQVMLRRQPRPRHPGHVSQAAAKIAGKLQGNDHPNPLTI